MKKCPVCNTQVEDQYTGLCPNTDCTWEFEFISYMTPEIKDRYEEKLKRARAAYLRIKDTSNVTNGEGASFDVVLKSQGSMLKLLLVKLIKDTTGVGIAEAKELIESVPKAIKERVTKDEAEILKKIFEEVGAEVEIRKNTK